MESISKRARDFKGTVGGRVGGVRGRGKEGYSSGTSEERRWVNELIDSKVRKRKIGNKKDEKI